MRKTFSNVYVSNTILDSVVDGVDIINLNDNKTELARKLNPFIKRRKPFKFLNFEVFSLGRFMLFLSYKKYPISNFTKPYYKKLGQLEKRKYDNFWGIIVVYLLNLIKHDDKTLIKLLKENNLPFNSYKDNDGNNVTLFGTQVAVKDKVSKLHGYCRCVEYVANLIKTVDIYDDEVIRNILTEDFPGIENTIIKLVDEVTEALKEESSKSLEGTKPTDYRCMAGIVAPTDVVSHISQEPKETIVDTSKDFDTSKEDKNEEYSKISFGSDEHKKADVSKLYEEDK